MNKLILGILLLFVINCSSSDCKVEGPNTGCKIEPGVTCIQPNDCIVAAGCLTVDCINGYCESLGCQTE